MLALLLLFLQGGWTVADDEDEAPPISITSPDVAKTYVYGRVKYHSLYWNKQMGLLIARVTFTDSDDSSTSEDEHEFKLPGVTLDAKTGVFSATSEKGETIPVAEYKTELFLKTIETTPNAHVRIIHPRGVVTVILEALSPSDPALRPSNPTDGSTNGVHSVNLNDILR